MVEQDETSQAEATFKVPEMFPAEIPVRYPEPPRRGWSEPNPKLFEIAQIEFNDQVQADLSRMGLLTGDYYVIGLAYDGVNTRLAFGTSLASDGSVTRFFEYDIKTVQSYQSKRKIERDLGGGI